MAKNICYTTADEAVSGIKSGSHIHIASASQVPTVLIEALTRRVENEGLNNLHFHHSYSEGNALFAGKKYAGAFIDQPFFIGPTSKTIHCRRICRLSAGTLVRNPVALPFWDSSL